MSSIRLYDNGIFRSCDFTRGETLLQILQREKVSVSAPCGGNGTCGKCTVKVQRTGKEPELLAACRTLAEAGMMVFPETETEAEICSDSITESNDYIPGGKDGYAAAVDLGTTTVAVRLCRRFSGESIGVISEMNSQRSYGADVISRVQYTMDNSDGLEILRERICTQIETMIQKLCRDVGIEREEVKETFISGNTIMQHILCGISPVSIAVAPFTPQTLFEEDAKGLEGYTYSPCISGYVGGDITSGILSSGLHRQKKDCLLIDLGTNGEMVLGSEKQMICCSVASGPAFEGMGISCGMAGTAGAISHVRMEDGRFVLETIGNAPPAGICGSGIIELTACLLKAGIIDGSGYLQPPDDLEENFGDLIGEDEDGNGIVYLTEDHTIFFSAKDVRQIQLAKAAVAAGIDILLQERGITADEVEKVCLAGGFGTYISVTAAAELGMLPETLADRTESIGNSSLAGAVLAASFPEARKELYRIPSICRYIELSGDARFNDLFAEHMEFYEEDY